MFQENVNIKDYTTFGINVYARYFTAFSSFEEIKKLLPEIREKKHLILGGGSNVLFLNDFDGIILKNEIKGIELIEEDKDSVVVKVGAGEVWHEFVLYAIQNNWGGIENLSLIPGSAGAGPMQNIGAYGVEIKDVFESLEAIEIETGKIREFSPEECAFGYRESVFKRKLKGKYIILTVSFRLSKKPKLNTAYGAIETALKNRGISTPNLKDVSEAVISIRTSKLPNPKEIGNAGSFFKNPVTTKQHFEKIRQKHKDLPFYPIDDFTVKIPAAWLIEQAGWKGKNFGEFGVHKKQALVLVNYNAATGKDIYELSEKIIESVLLLFEIQLEREVNIVS